MRSILTLATLVALAGVPNVQALGQKNCLMLLPEIDGGHGRHHGHVGSISRHEERRDGQVVLAAAGTHLDVPNADVFNPNSIEQSPYGAPPEAGSATHKLVIASRHHKHALPILLSSSAAPAVHLAAASFAEDVYKVTGARPKMYNDTLPGHVGEAIVVGIIGENGLDGEGSEGMEYMEDMRGQWESFDVRVVSGFKGLKRALRGAVYGLYDISEQMGISPWSFWDDVHVPRREEVSFDTREVCAHGEPTVKYRGVFINDELPVLWNWARETYNISYPESPIQVGLYERIFESTLRMKGNFMWPAMWVSMFAADGLNPQKNGLPHDPIPGPNQVLADRMGIFMGTSHHEPMSRTKPEWDLEGSGEWDFRTNKDNLTQWWEYGAKRAKGLDTVYTMGMRGDGDRPLTGASVELLEEITSTQREILAKVYETDHVEDVPQAWAMYKEVQGYYMQGLEVPDDVTTLFADDNWGNIRALLPYNHNHTGGGGVYYHADYVGVPTQYKWVNTINLAKTWEQMQIAKAYRNTNIWIINLGDIKHHELPTEHFMHLAYDFDAWPRNSVLRYLEQWAAREFGERDSAKIGRLMAEYTQAVDRLKPELLTSDSYSNLNYEEAERVESQWTDLSLRAKKMLHSLPRNRRDAFFEVVFAPIALVTQMNKMFIAGGKNIQHAYQGRTSANRYAEKAIAALHEDWRLSAEFEGMLDGKWKNMLSQPHTNAFWPLHNVRDTTPPLMYVQEKQPAAPRSDGTEPGRLMHVRYTHENSRGALPGPNYYNCAQHYECDLAVFNPTFARMDPCGAPHRWVDVASGGPHDVTWKAEYTAEWLKVQPNHGKISGDGTQDERVYVSIDWDKVPSAKAGDIAHYDNATVHFTASDGSNATFNVPIAKPIAPPSDFVGHVQGDGYVAIEAAHWTQSNTVEGYQWEEVEWYGKTLSGIEVYPTTDANFTASAGPSVSYDIWTTGYPAHLKQVEVTVQLGPTFNFVLGKELMFAVALDGDVRSVSPIPDYAPGGETVPLDWDTVVRNDIRNVSLVFDLKDADKPGKHTIELYGMTPGLIVERILVDMGGIKERGYSYFGPPESTRL